MYYIVEEINVKTSTNPDRWSDSKSVICIKRDLWRIKKYFRKIWTNYKSTHAFDEFHVEGKCVEFYIGDVASVRFYITDNVFI